MKVKITRPQSGNPYNTSKRVARPAAGFGGDVLGVTVPEERRQVDRPKARAPLPRPVKNRPSFLWEW